MSVRELAGLCDDGATISRRRHGPVVPAAGDRRHAGVSRKGGLGVRDCSHRNRSVQDVEVGDRPESAGPLSAPACASRTGGPAETCVRSHGCCGARWRSAASDWRDEALPAPSSVAIRRPSCRSRGSRRWSARARHMAVRRAGSFALAVPVAGRPVSGRDDPAAAERLARREAARSACRPPVVVGGPELLRSRLHPLNRKGMNSCECLQHRSPPIPLRAAGR